MIRNVGMECFNGLMVTYIRGISSMIIDMIMERCIGLMVLTIRVCGIKDIKMEREK